MAFRTGFLPRWLAWFTALVALGQLVALVFFPTGFLALIWMFILAGYTLAARRPVEAAPPVAAPPVTAT